MQAARSARDVIGPFRSDQIILRDHRRPIRSNNAMTGRPDRDPRTFTVLDIVLLVLASKDQSRSALSTGGTYRLSAIHLTTALASNCTRWIRCAEQCFRPVFGSFRSDQVWTNPPSARQVSGKKSAEISIEIPASLGGNRQFVSQQHRLRWRRADPQNPAIDPAVPTGDTAPSAAIYSIVTGSSPLREPCRCGLQWELQGIRKIGDRAIAPA